MKIVHLSAFSIVKYKLSGITYIGYINYKNSMYICKLTTKLPQISTI